MDYILKPIERFFKLESAGSILLMAATLAALILANSPLGSEFQEFWMQKLKVGFSDFVLSKPLILWINDGLMAIFFFMIGLEIKREILIGELNNIKKASLPIVGAIGGMVVPVALFFLFNGNNEGSEGWGIPMATDIAFTLGILTLLGKRVPIGLKVFLTAFAIVDDIGAVLVIALFYSSNIDWMLLFIALGLVGGLYLLNTLRIYSNYLFFVVGLVVWFLFLKSGVHPTLAGILLAFSIPVNRKINTCAFYMGSKDAIEVMRANEDGEPEFLTPKQHGALLEIERLTDGTISPLQSLEQQLHGWVINVIMPLFAFANAGVSLGGELIGLSWNIAGSMVLGKTTGIFLFVFLALKFKLASYPKNVNLGQLLGVSVLGGLGFTMALFISGLAYTDPVLTAGSKIGILMGSLVAGVCGYIIVRISLPKESPDKYN